MNPYSPRTAPPRTTSTRRTRTAAVAAGSFALTAGLIMSGATIGDVVQETQAQWTDAETISVDGTISWSDGGFARTMSNSITDHATYTAARNNVASTADPATANQVGTWGDEDLDGPATESTFEIRTLGDRPASSVNYCLQSAPPDTTAAPQPDCLPGGPEYTQDAQSRAMAWGRSGAAANPTGDADQPTVFVEAGEVRTMVECSPTGETWALVPSAFDPEWGQGIGVMAIAESAPEPPTVSEFVALEPEENSRVSAWIPAQEVTATAPHEANADDTATATETADATTPTTAPGTTQPTDPTYFHVSLTSRAYAVEGYALSDLYATVDQYHHESGEHLGSFTMVFARSECGVKLGPLDHQPLAADFEAPDAPAYPVDPASEPIRVTAAPVPDEAGIESVRSSRVSLHEVMAQDLRRELPSTTTVTSSAPSRSTTTLTSTTARSTATSTSRSRSTSTSTSMSTPTTTTPSSVPRVTTVTSTSVRPTGVMDHDDTTTATSTTTRSTSSVRTPTVTVTSTAAPTTVIEIPDELGDLSLFSRTEKVGTVEVGDEEFVVVVKGDELPDDARRGADALEEWLGGGSPGSDWETFESSDPDAYGWQWAAISQRTGTVVYIR